MPLLPSVSNVAPKPTKAPDPAKLASLARAREAQAAWGELGVECEAVMVDVRGQLAALRAALDGYIKDLTGRLPLKRSDRKSIVAATSALGHLDDVVGRLKDRDARRAELAARRAAKRAKGGRPRKAAALPDP